MLAISGRIRKEQIDLAAMLEVGDYPCPAGGCLLTDKPFARRIRDAIAHEELRLESIALLKIGMHFRLPGGSKLVVGRRPVPPDLLEKAEAAILPPSDPPTPPEDLMAATRARYDSTGTALMTQRRAQEREVPHA